MFASAITTATAAPQLRPPGVIPSTGPCETKCVLGRSCQTATGHHGTGLCVSVSVSKSESVCQYMCLPLVSTASRVKAVRCEDPCQCHPLECLATDHSLVPSVPQAQTGDCQLQLCTSPHLLPTTTLLLQLRGRLRRLSRQAPPQSHHHHATREEHARLGTQTCRHLPA